MLNWRKYKYGKGFYLSNIKKYIRKQLKRKKKKGPDREMGSSNED